MLLARERKILVLLYGKKRKFTTNELANALHVSPRTIKTDIKRIMEELEEGNTGCTINTKTGLGIWITYDEKGRQYLDNLLMNGDNYSYISPETRKYYVALKLLDADDYISMESIAESMYVSKGTIVNSINELTPTFEKIGLVLEKKVKYGMRVLGEEGKLRIARAYVIRKLVSNQGNYISSKLQPFFEKINLEKINDIIQEAEKKIEFILSDTSYSELVIQLAIVVKRILKGKSCTIEEDINKYAGKKELGITQYISSRLEEEFQIKLSDGDKSYLLINLLGINAQNETQMIDENSSNIEDLDPTKLKDMEEILQETGKVYNENLINDEMLKCALFMHLNAMFNRLRHQIRLENCIRHMVKEELVYEVEVASYMARLISERFNIELGENEICDIAMYLGASLERERAQKCMHKPQIVVVCGSGLGTSQFIEARLTRMFPNIIITKILPIALAKTEIKPGEQDFVVSTVPLILEGVDVISISPVLTENDVSAIGRRLNPDKVNILAESREKYSNLFGLMNEKISIFKCDCKSKEEVISLLGNRLLHEKYVDEGYTESAFKRERLAPTSIGDNFAVPHAFEGHVLKKGIGLMTLKKPIMWGNEKVQIVLMLSLDAKSQDLFKSVFTELADITKDTEAIAKILSADKLSNIKLK
ncbi:BglG family transcription antiterminator [Clostridium omnivorum]|uniref:PTS sugar transporter n=1 Tax=Clostridium omnivorum TaxID=1604902 RepID=A0ABQ5N2Z0_9CLOT|nr:BglG family transcription antiterminator [Clostridium sp. E14]GLC29577.1 PTS sugar transporter [Clostridium sp. E14]